MQYEIQRLDVSELDASESGAPEVERTLLLLQQHYVPHLNKAIVSTRQQDIRDDGHCQAYKEALNLFHRDNDIVRRVRGEFAGESTDWVFW